MTFQSKFEVVTSWLWCELATFHLQSMNANYCTEKVIMMEQKLKLAWTNACYRLIQSSLLLTSYCCTQIRMGCHTNS